MSSERPSETMQFDVGFQSDIQVALGVRLCILSIMKELGYSQRDLFCMELATEEAMVNAIRHGNESDAEKKIQVECAITRDMASIIITDEGGGFDPDGLPDPTADENLERPCGRGVMLMRKFMTSITYNEIGNQVTLIKNRSENGDASQSDVSQ